MIPTDEAICNSHSRNIPLSTAADAKKFHPAFLMGSRLQPTMNAAIVLPMLVEECFAQFTENQISFLQKGDSESIHQMRVAARRARVLLWIYKPMISDLSFRQLAKALKILQQTLSEARNLDVLCDNILPSSLDSLPRKDWRDLTRNAAAQLREESHRKLHQSVSKPEHTVAVERIKSHFSSIFEVGASSPKAKEGSTEGAGSFIAKRLTKLYRRINKGSKELPEPDSADFHQLRLWCKKQKYSAEFFSDLFDRRKFEKYIDAIEGLQKRLGQANDIVAMGNIIEQLGPVIAGSAGPEVEVTIKLALLEWRRRNLTQQKKQLKKAWNKFREQKPFWH
jgi:triphosphatase